MLNVQVTEKNINIKFSKDLISSDDLNEFINKLRLKYLISRSRMTEDDAQRLAKELKAGWWEKNKDRFLDKIQ